MKLLDRKSVVNVINKTPMKVVIAGDFTTEGRGMESVLQKKAISKDILSLLAKSDYSIVNLETPVANKNTEPIIKSGPHLSTRPETISYLKECGFHAVALANNHFYDYGEEGVGLTIEELEKQGLDYVGGGRTDEEKKKILIKEIQDTRIAIINYCEHEFSVKDGVGSNPISPIDAYYDIQYSKKHADIVLLIVHGGSETYQLPTPRMQKLYRFFVDLGADVVINHHQHCYSGYEKYHNGCIFYGLGNFFFDNPSKTHSKWNEGYLVSLVIDNKKVNEFSIIPYKQCDNNKVEVSLLSKEEDMSFYDNIDELNRIIVDERTLQNEFLSFCQMKAKNYYSVFSPYSNRYLRYLCKHGMLPSFIDKSKNCELLNYIECESHRDIVLYSLRNKVLCIPK